MTFDVFVTRISHLYLYGVASCHILWNNLVFESPLEIYKSKAGIRMVQYTYAK